MLAVVSAENNWPADKHSYAISPPVSCDLYTKILIFYKYI